MPHAHIRRMGSARSGVAHWWAQRVTAIALIPLSIWLLSGILCLMGSERVALVAWLHSPLRAAALIALLIAIFYHAYLGIQVILEDYVHHEGLRLALTIGVKFVSLACAIICILAVISLHLEPLPELSPLTITGVA